MGVMTSTQSEQPTDTGLTVEASKDVTLYTAS